MSYPISRRWVAKQSRNVCGPVDPGCASGFARALLDDGLVHVVAAPNARGGSTEIFDAGNTHCQAHSRSALRCFAARDVEQVRHQRAAPF